MAKLKANDPTVKPMLAEFRKITQDLPSINAGTVAAQRAAKDAIRQRRAVMRQRDTLRAAMIALHPAADQAAVAQELDGE